MYFRIGTDASPGVPLSELLSLPLQNAAQNIRFALFQPDRLVDGALRNDRLLMPPRFAMPFCEETSIFSFSVTSRS